MLSSSSPPVGPAPSRDSSDVMSPGVPSADDCRNGEFGMSPSRWWILTLWVIFGVIGIYSYLFCQGVSQPLATLCEFYK